MLHNSIGDQIAGRRHPLSELLSVWSDYAAMLCDYAAMLCDYVAMLCDYAAMLCVIREPCCE